MEFNFEPFTEVNRSYQPKVSIRSNGQIGLSQGLLQRVKIEDDDWYAQLFFDKGNRAMGIRFLRERDAEGAVKVQVRDTRMKDGHVTLNGHLSVRSFLDYYDIGYGKGKARSYTPTITDNGMVIVLLGDPGVLDPESAEDTPRIRIRRKGEPSEAPIGDEDAAADDSLGSEQIGQGENTPQRNASVVHGEQTVSDRIRAHRKRRLMDLGIEPEKEDESDPYGINDL